MYTKNLLVLLFAGTMLVANAQATDVLELQQQWKTDFTGTPVPPRVVIRKKTDSPQVAPGPQTIAYQPVAFAVSPDGRFIVTGGGSVAGGIVQCWEEGKLAWEFMDFAVGGGALAIHFLTPEVVLVGGSDRSIRALRVPVRLPQGCERQLSFTGKPVDNGSVNRGGRGPTVPLGLEVTSDKKEAVVVTGDAKVYVMDMTGAELNRAKFTDRLINEDKQRDLLTRGFNSSKIALAPDDQHILVLASQCVSVMRTQDLVEVSFTRLKGPFQVAAFLTQPSGTDLTVMLGGTRGSLQVWQLRTGGSDEGFNDRKATFIDARPVTKAEMEAELKASRERPVPAVVQERFKERNPGRLVRDFKAPGLTQAHPDGEWIKEIALSPDGRFAVTAALKYPAGHTLNNPKDPASGSLRVWDVATGQMLASLNREDCGFWHCQFTSKGDLVTTSSDSLVQVWRVQATTPAGSRQ